MGHTETGNNATAAVLHEPVGWQFWHAGEWRNGSPDHVVKKHRENTVAAGIPVRDIYAAPAPHVEQVLRQRIADMERHIRHLVGNPDFDFAGAYGAAGELSKADTGHLKNGGQCDGRSDALDAARWRHARKILAISEIEDAQAMHARFGGQSSEAESVRADAAIDAAMAKDMSK